MKDELRALPVLRAVPPPFDPTSAPDEPGALFTDWLRAAIDAELPEPHAMTVSTIGTDGGPDARVLILKDLDGDAWCFAGRRDSVKGAQVVAHPFAALTFYWRELGRQVRVRGPVRPSSPERSAQDFAERAAGSRASAMTGRQSTPLADPAEVSAATTVLLERLQNGAVTGLYEWTLWRVEAERVEFWQSHPTREHTRLQYERVDGRWRRGLLWP